MQQPQPSVINNFNQGYKTEFTGLNFPENASTDTQNCVFNRIGNVTRRPGINYETNFTQQAIDRTNSAINTYLWKNVGGDGLTQIVVTQVGSTLRFYRSSSATIAAPLSSTILASTISASAFVAAGGTFDSTVECQFVDGNGYLFVFHPSCDPFYCSYSSGTITANIITVQIRDFYGIPEATVSDTTRPSALTIDHNYNLYNQGWTGGSLGGVPGNPAWSTFDGVTTLTYQLSSIIGGQTLTSVSGGLAAIVGETVTFSGSSLVNPNPTVGGTATIVSYDGISHLGLNIISLDTGFPYVGQAFKNITITYPGSVPINPQTYINTFKSTTAVYPSNADIWWTFKNSSGVFDPQNTVNNVTLSSAPAPKGAVILQAFNQKRQLATGLSPIPNLSTTVRPRTGTWFQGRVWYAGVDAAATANPEFSYFTWTENIYFSQIVEKPSQFGLCYQINDPTSQNFFDLLPSDGGVVTIQGSGSIYKLFPIHNGLIVFAANGIWFITGSAGIGFTATDYTIVKVSSIQSISSTSFIDVRGAPYWCNEEGIYRVEAGRGDEGLEYGASRGSTLNTGLKVEPLTFTTIQTFYQNIPLSSKKYIRGTYDALNWEVKWIYLSTEAVSTTTRYQFNSILTLNTITQAFSPWTLPTSAGVPYINGIQYIQGPGGSTSPLPVIKYLVSVAIAGPSHKFTFAEENDTITYTDWTSNTGMGINFSSYFVTGYRLKAGQAQHKFQTEYLYMYSNNSINTSYRFQAIWMFGTNKNSGKYTPLSRIDITDSTTNFSNVIRRHRLGGRGIVNQFRVQSVDGKPFNIIGWSVDDKVNQGV